MVRKIHSENFKREAVKLSLTDSQFDALVSFTFNLGAGALQRSALRRKVNREQHAKVPRELMRWVWAIDRKLSGLIKRRAAESILYSGGSHETS